MQTSNLVMLSGQMALSQAMDVVANNIANASTTGYKREAISFDTMVNRVDPSEKTSYVSDRTNYRDASPGALTPTGNSLDLAIQGQGYLEVQTAQGIRYTRAGSLQTNTAGEIVTLSGQKILNDGGQGITLPETVSQLNIGADGFVTARVDNGNALAELGKIAMVKFDDESQLQSLGNGLYATTQTAKPITDDSSQIVQGSLESSNVQAITEMTNMMSIMRSYEQMANMISTNNQLASSAIDKLGSTTA